MNPFRIIVPASSANVGPGFDSMGLALELYLTLDVEASDQWELIFNDSPLNYEDNLIYKVAKETANRFGKELPSLKVVETSEIPLARGLGSSSSAILAGIEIANQSCDLGLTNEQKLQYGTEFEGHPDNIAPALFGGLVISTVVDHEIHHITLTELELDVIVYIPSVELKTEEARSVLPETYSRDLAAHASGVSNIAVASLLSANYELAGKMMEHDLFHEPYRKGLIPNYDMIRNEAKNLGVFGTMISGAGPTMLSIVQKGKGQEIANMMQDKLLDYQVKALGIDVQGMKVI